MEDKKVLIEIRQLCLKLANKAKDGNLQSVFSSLEILWCLYNRILNYDFSSTNSNDRDYFLCSKGQATLGLLCVLAKKGIIEEEELLSYGMFNSRISMQADRTKFDNGIEISAGSLGHGLPIAAGIAMTKKIQNARGKVYVLVGDGEMHEGTNWEACGFISYRNLDNVRLIIDDNNSHNYMYGQEGLKKRLLALDFVIKNCCGNDIDQLYNVLSETKDCERPVAIIANTKRGYGSKTLMTKKEWFHKAPTDNELESMLDEVLYFDNDEARNYVLRN